MLRGASSDAVQITSTVLGVILSYIMVTSWFAKKKADPSQDPLQGGTDPGFSGGAPIDPHLHDPVAIVPSCEIYDQTSNLFMNLGNPTLDYSLKNCFDGVDPNAIVRYTDNNHNMHWLHDQLYIYATDEPGTCVFPDQDGKLYTPIKFAPPNQASRLCFNSSDTHKDSAFFFLFDDEYGFQWNPNVNVASAALPNWKLVFPPNVTVGTKDIDEIQVLTGGTLFSPTDETFKGYRYLGSAFVRDPSANGSVDVELLDGQPKRRLFLPSKGLIIYFNPRATNPAQKYVSYPMLAN